MQPRYVENVPYYRFRIRYTLATGQRRRMFRWSPGFPWVRDEIGRELLERYTLDGIKPGSVTIESAAPAEPDAPCAYHDSGNSGPCNRCEGQS